MSHHPPDTTSARDADRIYRAIFRAAPAPRVVERFLAADRLLTEGAAADEIARCRRVLDSSSDLEAIEVAARYRRQLPLLGARFRLMVYIAESEPDNQHYFAKRSASRAAAVAALAAGGIATAWKLARGALLLARVRHG